MGIKSGHTTNSKTKAPETEACLMVKMWKPCDGDCCTPGESPHTGYKLGDPAVGYCLNDQLMIAKPLSPTDSCDDPFAGTLATPPTWQLCSLEQWIKILSCPGPAGADGATGATGATGPQGPAGTDFDVAYACNGGKVPQGGVVAGIGDLFPALPAVFTGGKGSIHPAALTPATPSVPTYLTTTELATGTGLTPWGVTAGGWVAPYSGVVELNISLGVGDDINPRPSADEVYRIAVFKNGVQVKKVDVDTSGSNGSGSASGSASAKDNFHVQVAEGDVISHEITAVSAGGHGITDLQVGAEYKGCGTVTDFS